MINKPRQINGVKAPSDSTSSVSIKWCSYSSPRPPIGIPNVLYINTNKHVISIWSPFENRYVDFYDSHVNQSVTTNNNTIVESNISSSDNKTNSSFYSFDLVDDSLIITNPDGVIQEISIPNTSELEDKIKQLEERIEKLEELLG